MLNENNRAKLLKEILYTKEELLLIEEFVENDEVFLPDMEQLSDAQVQNIWEKLRLANNTIITARALLASLAERDGLAARQKDELNEKRYIGEQAALIAKKHGANVDDVVGEIVSSIVNDGSSIEDALQQTSLQFGVCKACGIPFEMVRPKTLTAESVTRSERIHSITERSARAIAEEIEEAIKRQMK